MKNVKNDPSPRSVRRWAGSGGGLGPADRATRRPSPPRLRRRRRPRPQLTTRLPRLRTPAGRPAALPSPTATRVRREGKWRRACARRPSSYPPRARRGGLRPPPPSVGTVQPSHPPPATAREPRAKTRMKARAGRPRRPEGRQRGRREAGAGAGANAVHEGIGRAA